MESCPYEEEKGDLMAKLRRKFRGFTFSEKRLGCRITLFVVCQRRLKCVCKRLLSPASFTIGTN